MEKNDEELVSVGPSTLELMYGEKSTRPDGEHFRAFSLIGNANPTSISEWTLRLVSNRTEARHFQACMLGCNTKGRVLLGTQAECVPCEYRLSTVRVQ